MLNFKPSKSLRCSLTWQTAYSWAMGVDFCTVLLPRLPRQHMQIFNSSIIQHSNFHHHNSMAVFSITLHILLNWSIWNVKVDVSTVCAHKIRYHKQALLSLLGNLSWPLKLMLCCQWMKRPARISRGSNPSSYGQTIKQVISISAICLHHRWLMPAKLLTLKLLFSLLLPVKGYTSRLLCARCGNLRQRTQKWDRWVFLTGYPVLSRAAGPTPTSSPLLTPDPLIV